MRKIFLWLAVSSLIVDGCLGNGLQFSSHSSSYQNSAVANQPQRRNDAKPNRQESQQFHTRSSPNDFPKQVLPDGAANNFPPLLLAQNSEGNLATALMAEIGKYMEDKNIIISPFGVWGILAMIYGVSGGNTAKELSALLQATDKRQLEIAYKDAYDIMNSKSKLVETKTLNVVAVRKNHKLKQQFNETLKNIFDAKVFEFDLTDPEGSEKKMNQWASDATLGRIYGIAQKDDFKNMKLLLCSASFFKGRWKYPFNITATFIDQFKDENDTIIADVNMMRLRAVLKHGFNVKIDSQVLEIPYGDDQTSMIVFLPRRKTRTQAVLEKMKGSTLSDLLPSEMSEEEVDLSLPRFTTSFRVNLNQIFIDLNAADMHSETANLPGLSPQDYITRISQVAEIETSEEGTTASAVTSAHVSYKTSAITFQANRPFIYFINHIPTRLILFSGKFSNPNDMSS